MDLRRLERALFLTAERAGDGWLVSGGTHSWLVNDATGCPCPDKAIRGGPCKHELRVELAMLAPALLAGLRALVGDTQVPTRPRSRVLGQRRAPVPLGRGPRSPDGRLTPSGEPRDRAAGGHRARG